MRIAFLGGCDVDRCYTLSGSYPQMGGKAFVSDKGVSAGGMVANASIIAAGLGINAEIFHELSKSDSSTKIILDEFLKAGVGIEGISLGERSNKQCLIMSSPRGERVIFVVKEPDSQKIRLSGRQQEAVLAADCIYTSISDIQSFLDPELLCRTWRAAGKEVFIDCDAHISLEEMGCLRHASIVSLNEFGLREAENLGFTVESLLREYEIPILIVTKGAEGAELHTKESNYSQKAIPASVVDTTGAGDTFNISFLYSFLSGFSLEKSLHFAACAAAQAVSQRGPRIKIDLKIIKKMIGFIP